MKYIVIILIFLSFNFSYSQQGDNLPGSKPNVTKSSSDFQAVPAEIKSKVAKFFNTLMDDKVAKAYEDFLANTPLGKKNEDVTNLKKQTTRAFELYGGLKGYDPVNFEAVGSSFIRVRYLGLHSRFPMRWVITFYKSPDLGWIPTNIKFDDLSDFFFEDQ